MLKLAHSAKYFKPANKRIRQRQNFKNENLKIKI